MSSREKLAGDVAVSLTKTGLAFIAGGPVGAAGAIIPDLFDYGLQWLRSGTSELDRDLLQHHIYPINEHLFTALEQLEAGYEELANKRDEPSDLYCATPEKFYTFRRGTSWIGVHRGWDVKRHFHDELLEQILRVPQSRFGKPPTAGIVGPGGSGKSISLRRLAIDLVGKDKDVWWVDQSSKLGVSGVQEKLGRGEVNHRFLLVDEVEHLDDKVAEEVLRLVSNTPSLNLIVAGRSLPGPIRGRLRSSDRLIELKLARDREAILDKIAEIKPEWSESARILKQAPFREARLIRVLLVLARAGAAPGDREELEQKFVEIVKDDVIRVADEVSARVALAVVESACVRTVGYDVSLGTFARLAGVSDVGEYDQSVLEPTGDNRRWQILSPLMEPDEQTETAVFQHDELAWGILEAAKQGLLMGTKLQCEVPNAELLPPTGDPQWMRGVLQQILQEGSRPSSSVALYGFARDRMSAVGEKTIRSGLKTLLEQKNDHYRYLMMLVDGTLQLEKSECKRLLFKAAEIVPLKDVYWGFVIHHQPWLRKDERLLRKLYYEVGCRAAPILVALLKILPKAEKQQLAKECLESSNRHTSEIALAASLRVLEDGGAPWVRDHIDEARVRRHAELYRSCLHALPREEASENVATVLNTWWESLGEPGKESWINPEVIAACMKKQPQLGKIYARMYLERVHSENVVGHPAILGQSLDLLGTEASKYALSILSNWPEYGLQTLEKSINIAEERNPKAARRFAQAYLGEYIKNPDQVGIQNLTTRSLRLLGSEACDKAQAILDLDSKPDSSVLAVALETLAGEGDETEDSKKGDLAEEYAERILRSEDEIEWDLLSISLRLAPQNSRVVKCRVINLLQEEDEEGGWSSEIPSWLKARALSHRVEDPIRKERAHSILEEWQKRHRRLVSAALRAYWDCPEEVREVCNAILERWHQDLYYQHKNDFDTIYGGHIRKALANPSIPRVRRRESVRQMWEEHQRNTGFIPDKLVLRLEGILVADEWPQWSSHWEEES